MNLPPRYESFPTSKQVLIDLGTHWVTGFYQHNHSKWMYYDVRGYTFPLSDEQVDSIVGWSFLNEKTDPKNLGLPNINFSTESSEENEIEYTSQRLNRGFDDSELINLDETIIKFITPRLKRFVQLLNDTEELTYRKKYNSPYPSKKDLNYLIAQFELYLKGQNKDVLKMQKVLNLFVKNFLNLWL